MVLRLGEVVEIVCICSIFGPLSPSRLNHLKGTTFSKKTEPPLH